ESPDDHAVGGGRLLPLHARDEVLHPGEYRLDFVVARLRPLLRRHGPLAEHVAGFFQGRYALRERRLVRELVKANIAALLVGVAVEAVFGKKRLNGPLILAPAGRRVCVAALAAATRCETQDEQRTEDGPRPGKSRPAFGRPHGRPRRRAAN